MFNSAYQYPSIWKLKLLTKEIFNPSYPVGEMGMCEGFYWEALIKYYGIGPADKLFRNVALETLKTYPLSILMFWDNILAISLIKPFALMDGIKSRCDNIVKLQNWDCCDINYSSRKNDFTGLSNGLKAELEETIVAKDGEWVKVIAIFFLFKKIGSLQK